MDGLFLRYPQDHHSKYKAELTQYLGCWQDGEFAVKFYFGIELLIFGGGKKPVNLLIFGNFEILVQVNPP